MRLPARLFSLLAKTTTTLSLIALILGLILFSGITDSSLLPRIAATQGMEIQPHWSGILRMTGLQIGLDSALLLFALWAFYRHRQHANELLQNPGFLLKAALLGVTLIILPGIFFGRSTSIDGQRIFWLGDDAMISMRYAANLAHGHGLVWNPGEPVEGYTNLLWTVYMALFHLVPIPPAYTSLPILLTSLALSLATLPLLVNIHQALGGSPLALALSLTAYTLNFNLMDWTTSGFETILLLYLFTLSLARILTESARPRLLTYAIIGLTALVRADAFVLSGLLLVIAFLLSQQRARVIYYAMLAILFPALQFAFRLAYYGEWLPNTAYLKVYAWDGRIASGLAYIREFLSRYALMLLFAAFGAWKSPSAPHRVLLAALALYSIYLAYVGGDAFPNLRFYVPFLPVVFVLAFQGLDFLVRARFFVNKQSLAASLWLLTLLTSPLILQKYTFYLLPNPRDVGNIEIALLIKQNTAPQAKIADTWAGSVFYFSERYGIDLLGKSDRHIAQLTVHQGRIPGHNKFDYDYSLRTLQPDIVIASFHLPVDENEIAQQAQGDTAFIGQLYFNNYFRENCLPYPIASPTWRTLFACAPSAEVAGRNTWQELSP